MTGVRRGVGAGVGVAVGRGVGVGIGAGVGVAVGRGVGVGVGRGVGVGVGAGVAVGAVVGTGVTAGVGVGWGVGTGVAAGVGSADGSSAAATAHGIDPSMDVPRAAARSQRRIRGRASRRAFIERAYAGEAMIDAARWSAAGGVTMVPSRCGAAPGQKLGGVRQKSTVAGVSPWLTFQWGSRDGNVMASPSRRT